MVSVREGTRPLSSGSTFRLLTERDRDVWVTDRAERSTRTMTRLLSGLTFTVGSEEDMDSLHITEEERAFSDYYLANLNTLLKYE